MRTRGWFLVLIIGVFARAGARSAPEPDVQSPEILSRKEWAAKAPVAAMGRHQPNRITIHHTATVQKPARSLQDKMKALQLFSQSESKLSSGKLKPVWPDVPYHYYIDCRGAIAEGREVEFVGDTNTDYDPTGHVLVVLEGNFEEETPTEGQWSALVRLVSVLAERYKVAPEAVQGHKDYAQTLCPGRKLEVRLGQLRAAVIHKTNSHH